MADGRAFEYDVFVSYRWAEPDRSWVRDQLVPALQRAGLRVCLDVNDFIPGRDLILEMTRAGQASRCALCVVSANYFAGNRMVHFESLVARRRDPGGLDSRLVPLLLQPTDLPDWIRGLIPVDWTDETGRDREWRKLLDVLDAPQRSAPPGAPDRPTPLLEPETVFLHDYNLPEAFVARDSELRQLKNLLIDGGEVRTRVLTVTAIGGVGKSCLCRRLIEQDDVARSFSRTIWFSFYEARGEAEEYFFREVLSHTWRRPDNVRPPDGTLETVRLRRALTEQLDAARTLLVLDGIEVIQFTDDPLAANFGAIKSMWSEIDKLLRHILNSPTSVCLITSRVSLRNYEKVRGYREVPLDLFTSGDGAQLLRALGVQGQITTLEDCAKNLGGHALSLVAAGRYMARRKIDAAQLIDLIGDADIFRRTPEGEKVKRISEWYRSELTPEQEYFLTRLSLHGRSVTSANYPVLIPGYVGVSNDSEVEEKVIQPLVERGLVERLDNVAGEVRFTAHPLMKLAFSTWLEPAERRRAHEEWARAAASSPRLFFRAADAMSLEELQPLIDATEQYLAAENWREAWSMYSERGLGSRLGQLGYFELSLKLGCRFVEISAHSNEWSAFESVYLFDKLAWLCDRLEREDDELIYRRKELVAAREAGLAEAESLAAVSLASAGFVLEVGKTRPADASLRARLALARGQYAKAVNLLRLEIQNRVGHQRSTAAQVLAEALYRSGKLDDACKVLGEALRHATDRGFNCCQKAILGELVGLALRRGDLSEAQKWTHARDELLRRLEVDVDMDPWLLLAEGDYGAAFKAADARGTSSPRRKIERHVMRARIFLTRGNRHDASIELNSAEREMALSGYAQLNNDIAELRQQMITL